MSLIRRGFLAMSVASLLVATQAFAGGNGGTKKNATINFVNSSTQIVGVYYDDTNAKITAAGTDTTDASAGADFSAGGGVILYPNQSHAFSVKAGEYTTVAFDEAQAKAAHATGNSVTSPNVVVVLTPVVANAGMYTTLTIANSTTNPPVSQTVGGANANGPDITVTQVTKN